MLLTMSPYAVWLLGHGDGDEFHDAPDDVKDRWKYNADEQQEERVVEDFLHDRTRSAPGVWK
jgi:hypothetical protein